MYEEPEQKILHMSIKEFKTWEIPDEWHIVHISAEWERTAPSVAPGHKEWEFNMRIIIKKGVGLRP